MSETSKSPAEVMRAVMDCEIASLAAVDAFTATGDADAFRSGIAEASRSAARRNGMSPAFVHAAWLAWCAAVDRWLEGGGHGPRPGDALLA